MFTRSVGEVFKIPPAACAFTLQKYCIMEENTSYDIKEELNSVL